MVRSKNPSSSLKYLSFFCLALISLFSYKLLINKFYAFPAQGDTYDEYKAPFNGISLWLRGVPESWSWYPDYGNFPTTTINGGIFRLVKPWFDEPALFSLLVGAYSLSRGINSYDSVDIAVIRHPMVFVGVFNVVLLFLIIYKSHSLWLAIISSLIYASVPTIVLSQRLPISDNMVTTFLLVSILLTFQYLKKPSRLLLILLSLVAASSLHLKSTGVFIPVSIVAIFWSAKKIKASYPVIILTVISLLIWFLYGHTYNWTLFLKIMSLSSGRELTSPTLVINLFQTFRIGEKTMGIDGWLVWGWISVTAISFLKFPRRFNLSRKLLIYPLVSYLIFFSIMSGHIKGWYRDPFFPLLSWASGLMILKMIQKPKILSVFMFTLIPVVSSYVYGSGGIRWSNPQTKIYQISLVTFFVPFMLNEIFHNRYLRHSCQVLVILLFISAIFLNYQTIVQYPDYFYYFSL